jgi:hypothetical protein
MGKLTQEEIEAKASELKEQLKVDVHPLVFQTGEGDQVVGYIKEPDRMVKLRVLDKGMISPVSAAAELFEVIMIKDASDPRIWGEKPEFDKFYLGAVIACYDLIKLSVNTFKKK